ARPRRHGVGRGGGFPAGAVSRAGVVAVADGGLHPVSAVRHSQAAADPLLRPDVQERFRRDAGRPGRRFLHSDRDRRCGEIAGDVMKAQGTRHKAQGAKRRPSALYRLAEKTGKALKKRGLMLTTAESCTGGWIAEAVTMVPGSSEWFERGF